ncbi:MAG TPA: cytochrome c oxidase subunit 3 [Pyrinomonadaceae bacterium]|nr:cytochrome c oxidase subunit 3 [Pyrinomonadaceae bacterium]
MATMVTGTRPRTRERGSASPGFPGPGGNGSRKRNGDDPFFHPDSRSNRYRIGVWVALAAIVMMFTALTSAYIVRAASSDDWQALPMPRILAFSTAVILISSATIEAARRKLKADLHSGYTTWLGLTTVLGLAFLVSQLLAWRQLVRQGVYVASHPHSSFFYLLTATHGVHLLGGLFGILYLLLRSRRTETELMRIRTLAAVDAATIYWHFMDALWIYLFLLLFFWR